ncbi:methylmalonyl-CoA mutase family protein, partial [bacterium]|nr:methylmalonyl-CoA mutase family protein [bacterium]
MHETVAPYQPKNHVRIVTAASLFDGHDAAINIMRRLLQAGGAEVIHLGHNRSVKEIVDCAVQEDAQGIAITSYQGGHLEFFKYMHDLLREAGVPTRIYGGGGGTILPAEIAELHAYGIDRIFSPDDGRALGLQGMIDVVLQGCDFATIDAPDPALPEALPTRDPIAVARLVTLAENAPEAYAKLAPRVEELAAARTVPVLGVTGTGGAGKSSLVDELVRRYLNEFADRTIAVVSVDPSKRKSGGALLGDRIRMNAIDDPRVTMRSLATRQANLSLSRHVRDAVQVMKAAGHDLVIVETSGIGQSDTEITEHSDVALYVMTAEYGAATQLEKIDMLDFADVVAINKFDHRGSQDALRDVRKQFARNHELFTAPPEELPVFGTIASQFHDPGMNALYGHLMGVITERCGADFASSMGGDPVTSERNFVIPPARTRYLAEIVDENRRYGAFARAQADLARRACALWTAVQELRDRAADPDDVLPDPAPAADDPAAAADLWKRYEHLLHRLDGRSVELLRGWPEIRRRYREDELRYTVRGKEIALPLVARSLSGSRVPKVSLPRFACWGDLLHWLLTENLPGEFPYAAGVFPLKREGEDPTRMFAGEGGPERTNRRFHYVSLGMPAKRLSTAFDSVTLYGENPDRRP